MDGRELVRDPQSPAADARSRFLLLTSGYPSAADLYRNGFIHRRVLMYRRAGMEVDVFWLSSEARGCEAYHFDGVHVVKGDEHALDAELAARSGSWRSALLHFAEPAMLRLLDRCAPGLPAIVWVHGVEAEGWRRRLFNVRGPRSLAGLLRRLPHVRRQMAFMRRLYAGEAVGRPLDVVFVSDWYRRHVAEADAGVSAARGHVIPNFVDGALFAFAPKPPDAAYRVLSIRSFAHRKYANDLSVKAILALSERGAFEKYAFTLIGEGPLWQATTRPLRALPNVRLERRFLRQEEIAAEHRAHGLFLCPTRLDAQGVSMGEAMASGLVPVTTAATAIPEFVDERCGILAPSEEPGALADGIERVARDSAAFERMSHEAARRVRAQCGYAATIERELSLMRANGARRDHRAGL